MFRLLIKEPLANGLIIFYRLFGENMGIAIIAFTIALRLALNPLTKKYMDSMKKMREFAPQLNKLKDKHKGDKTKLLQAQMEFYKQKGIKPGGGFLPYIVQIVILITFFSLFMNVFSNQNIVEGFNQYLYEPLKLSTDTAINLKFLYADISKPDVFKVDFLPFALPGPIIIIAALVQGISAKLMSPQTKTEAKLAGKTKEVTDDFATAMQNSAIYTFPIITILAGMRFPAGLALYWAVFSLFQLVQQTNGKMFSNLLKSSPWKKLKN
ncbi:hypothetical protein A2630_05040 [Candidatus Woesebacteria bacterium RIFCSPHIGHO2_01_FULL_44_10]|uniref:Membrane insertase YidC/Oxa/ALB C-terminal domain-containing protein n=1 Tax=Candidatus Woesebacteria bacterium RIFCSPLOWO2_01_FULL_44_14 TaxID=1802525 RepID=A0A1F8C137_9BACT|nr:MAG: hypothetical protein A2630_05040 [Candidatus Woesebacteria bacterium RIFCSPHIGHO2_01_FULL_44_10]OGM53718.1 MAG: hypothetical protein A3F62_03575 [Candidatus Woesebacteria bacterium RIFCSPHIGHO2_12_FULL_44_11]OGM70064.1 MAG: hypothetical protein A2975_03240 [Candidatus Woesebacteria bacterium RIFCSPLOWO2_01_FULL_44_14]